MPRHDRRLAEPREGSGAALTPAECVQNYRKLRGWTQEIAAQHHGVSVRTWQRYEAPTGRAPRKVFLDIWRWVTRACPENKPYVLS